MKVVLVEALPRRFMDHPAGGGILVEGEVKASRGSCLAAKVLVFKDRAGLQSFWRDALNNEADDCEAIVTALGHHISDIDDKGQWKERFECDPTYFCVMGFFLGPINMEIVCHESVHAAFQYAKRVGRASWSAKAFDNDEEQIAYPAGRIARGINLMFHDLGVYADQDKLNGIAR